MCPTKEHIIRAIRTTKRQNKIVFVVSIVLFLVSLILFILLPIRLNNSQIRQNKFHRETIERIYNTQLVQKQSEYKTLQSKIDSLTKVNDNQYTILVKKQSEVISSFLKNQSKIQEQYEKNISIINVNSVDDNIEFLSNYLNKQ